MNILMQQQEKKNLGKRFIMWIDSFKDAWRARPYLFTGTWLFVFVFLFSASWSLGLVPELDLSDEEDQFAATEESDTENNVAVLGAQVAQADNGVPVRIVIDRIGVAARINNPKSRDIQTLDAALLENDGVVHYPGSGNLEDTNNIFLFGHSTGFRVVQNEVFKVFNNLKELEDGDIIRMQSETKEYLYRVEKVTLTNAEDAWVELSNREKKLTLSTCNSFGAKQERYVVTALFVGSYDL